MNFDIDDLKSWLSSMGKDRHWLADELGVSKRTLDNWFSSEFPLYGQKAIGFMRQVYDLKAKANAEDAAINLTLPQWKELSRRAREAGYEDEMEYVSAVIKEAIQ